MNNDSLCIMQIFDEYEKRFAKAKFDKKFILPTDLSQKQKILDGVYKMLCFSDALVPTVSNSKIEKQRDLGDYVEYQVTYETWKNVFGSATVMIPKNNKPVPVTFILCGHGKKGRLTESYALMAHRLAKCGTAVIVPDNIGQGDREFMGHWNVVSPFNAGLNLQGLIVAETLALIKAVKSHPKFDGENMCALGNSGGGTLTMFLTALAPELKAVASSGYPSEFEGLLSKEKTHCACNLLKGCVCGPEMWEIFSLFAPKPLLLSQGCYDTLIPLELAKRNARKVSQVYTSIGAQQNFKFEITATKHPWAEEDRILISNFLLKVLGLKPCDEIDEQAIIDILDDCSVKLPENAIGVDELVFNLTGVKTPKDIKLQDIIHPTFNGEKIDASTIDINFNNDDVLRIFAQMEYSLKTV
ncbi:MAG: acetylxylan esterase [Clostridia bacterium]|nr:acetylxylan esterase [Clostridia bacterium]